MNPIYKFNLGTNENVFNRYLEDTRIGVFMTSVDFRDDVRLNTSGKIPVNPGDVMFINIVYTLCFFNVNDSRIYYTSNKNDLFVIAPANAVYMRVCVWATDWYDLEVNKLTACNPTYKDDLAKEYELETNQRFYRAKLSGKISFIRDDFEYIRNKAFETEFMVYLQQSDDLGKTWIEEFKGKFFKTDCTINEDDKKISVQLDPLDEYNDVLAGLEKEYNLIDLAPVIDRLLVQKRPLIQVYIPGDSIVSCFLGGTFWEQDAEPTTDRNKLTNRADMGGYNFALCNMLKEMTVTMGSGTPTDIAGLYTGKMTLQSGTNNFTGTLASSTATAYEITVAMEYQPPFFGIVVCRIVRKSDGQQMFEYATSVGGSGVWDNLTFTMNAVNGSGATGTASVSMATYNIYARYLLDVEQIRGLNTYEITGDDIVDYNRNYRRTIGYAINIAYISRNASTTPTQWGRMDNGQYFAPPYSIWGQKYFPIARSTWRNASIWFGFAFGDEYLERDGRKTYTLRDAFPVSSVLSVLLKQFSNVTHEATEEYSQFFYGASNPISAQTFRLYVTQKSNLLVGDYQQPTQKAPTTLQQFTNMLRDTYQCYWYIEGGKFKIEHISWFKNGGSYYGGRVVGTDLTTIENVRNAKKWGFATSEYSFDKVDLAERYQFNWMDDVTEAFDGYPIEVISKYVTPGKIEEISIGNFTSDVDMMMLAPATMSNDGFALFAAVTANGILNPDSYGAGSSAASGQLSTPLYDVRPEIRGRTSILHAYAYGNNANFRIVFYRNGTVISRTGSYYSDTGDIAAAVVVPSTADQMGYESISGVVSFFTWKLEATWRYELPFTERSIDGVTFFLQNGYLAFINLQPLFWTSNLPARRVRINGSETYVYNIERKKKQTLNFPMPTTPNLVQLIKTYIGSGEIDKMSINLCSRMSKTTVKYDTE